MDRSAARLLVLPAALTLLLVPVDVAGRAEVTSAVASAESRRDVALVGAPPIQQMSVTSAIQCSALCLRKASHCSAITLLPGHPPTCQLHGQQLCENATLSLEALTGARYFDVYDSPADLTAEGGPECENRDRFSPTYCSGCPPSDFIPPAAAYQCVQENCLVRDDYFLHESYIYLPKWQEFATDGKLAIRKHRRITSQTLRLEVRVSKIAHVTLQLRGISYHSNIKIIVRMDTLTLGTEGNTGIKYSGHTVLSGAESVLSTTEWFRITFICASRICGIYGEDENTQLYQIPDLETLDVNELIFSSPLGVVSRWRAEQDVVDDVLTSSKGADGYPQHFLLTEGAFLRLNATNSYEFAFRVTGYCPIWIEFREIYMWQPNKVVRVIVYSSASGSVAAYISNSMGNYTVVDEKPFSGLDSAQLREIVVSLTGTTVRVSMPVASAQAEVNSLKSLAEINYIGIGCDDYVGALFNFSGGDPGWSTLGWKEDGSGYSTGSNLI